MRRMAQMQQRPTSSPCCALQWTKQTFSSPHQTLLLPPVRLRSLLRLTAFPLLQQRMPLRRSSRQSGRSLQGMAWATHSSQHSIWRMRSSAR